MKKREKILKLKKMGGDEGTILKHKVKAREKKCLTNKKPTFDMISQYRIPILWIDQARKDTNTLKKTKLQMH